MRGVRGRILTYGDIPPKGGERRRRYLTDRGRDALVLAGQRLQEAIWLLEPVLTRGRSAETLERLLMRTVDGSLNDLQSDEVVELWDAIRNAVIERVMVDYLYSMAPLAYRKRILPDGSKGTLHMPGEQSARLALQLAVDGFNYLEDSPLEGEAHDLLHACGALVGGVYGCYVLHEGGIWWDVCPTQLAHVRLGFSPGFTATWVCTICGQDVSECPHMRACAYPVVAAVGEECNICSDSSCELHEEGETYLVYPRLTPRDAVIEEVSLVPRPRDPMARISAIQFTPSDWGFHADPGEKIRCHRCVLGCQGFVDPVEFLPDEESLAQLDSDDLALQVAADL